MNRTYTTRTEAMQAEIIDPIEAWGDTAAGYDIEAIADKVLGDSTQGYACQVDHDDFWELVENSER